MSVQTTTKREYPISEEEMAALRERSKLIREEFKHKPGRDELISPEDQANAAPFYFALRAFIKQLKGAREVAGFTLAQVAEKTGLAEETLCRLESGAVTNPTWKTLGLYAAAVDRDMILTAKSLKA